MKPSTTDLVIIASAKAKPGMVNELEQALAEAAIPTRLQPGCISFGLYRSQDDPNVVMGIERWTSSEAHGKHLQGAHVQTLMTKFNDILAEMPVISSYTVANED